MFTVLIAEKNHIDAIQQDNKLFFEPFLESKELAFCCWNPLGQNLQDSVPGLLDAVGRKKEWRAVIINNNSDELLKTRNPFDVIDCSSISHLVIPNRQPDESQDWNEWETSWRTFFKCLTVEKEKYYKSAIGLPLQRLATWLCYKPEDYILNEVQEKHDVHDWAMEQIGRDDLKPSVKLELMEREQYKTELRLKETIRRTFLEGQHLNISYPAEVHCVSLRTAERSFFDPDTYWNIPKDSEYSAFADRNMYFDKMRFMVFDLLPKSHRNYRTDYIRFLATVLIFISNPVPTSAMQSRYLYQIDTETDDTPLCTLVTSYDRKLAATSEVIDNEMEKIRSEIPGELTDKAAEALFCTPKDIPVLLDASCDPDKVAVDNDYGLFYDSPEKEDQKWNRDYLKSKKELGYIVKQQSRSVRKSVSQLNAACEITDVNISRLTPIQVDDVRDYADMSEDDMIMSIPTDFSDISRYEDNLTHEAETVKKIVNQRMTRKSTTILSCICLGLFFACFLPFLFSNNNTTNTITVALVLSISMIAVISVIMLITLFALREKLKGAIRAYNNASQNAVNEIHSSLKQHSKYLSAVCNVRRGHSVQNFAKKNLDEYTRSLRIRKRHQEDIRKRRAYLVEEYGDYLGDRSCVDEIMSKPYDYDFDQCIEYNYPAPFLAGDCRQIEFISNGNMITVPSSYVKRINVRLEGIYEK